MYSPTLQLQKWNEQSLCLAASKQTCEQVHEPQRHRGSPQPRSGQKERCSRWGRGQVENPLSVQQDNVPLALQLRFMDDNCPTPICYRKSRALLPMNRGRAASPRACWASRILSTSPEQDPCLPEGSLGTSWSPCSINLGTLRGNSVPYRLLHFPATASETSDKVTQFIQHSLTQWCMDPLAHKEEAGISLVEFSIIKWAEQNWVLIIRAR